MNEILNVSFRLHLGLWAEKWS